MKLWQRSSGRYFRGPIFCQPIAGTGRLLTLNLNLNNNCVHHFIQFKHILPLASVGTTVLFLFAPLKHNQYFLAAAEAMEQEQRYQMFKEGQGNGANWRDK